MNSGQFASLDVLLVAARRELDELWAGFEDAHSNRPAFEPGNRHEAGRKSFVEILQILRGIELTLKHEQEREEEADHAPQ